MLSSKVLEWMNKTGFPLEMETALSFKKQGFDVYQSFCYNDLQADKPREIDVLVRDDDPECAGVIDISFVLECKASKKPWVVLKGGEQSDSYNRVLSFGITLKDAKAAFVNKLMNKDLSYITEYTDLPLTAGYDFRQAMSGENDPAFNAAIGVIKASLGYTQDSLGRFEERLSFCFPVIVVNSPLFECTLNDVGELQLKEVQRSSFNFSSYLPERISTTITVITKSELKSFSKEAKALAKAIRLEFSDVEKSVISELISRRT
ncbi:hypothetical protein ACED51_24020 [Photobacterium swingsii]|uniref:hypothetical protein n=1 Tax=Photobacterium swingsii TaxID=680026 RepID=UPI00352F74D5